MKSFLASTFSYEDFEGEAWREAFFPLADVGGPLPQTAVTDCAGAEQRKSGDDADAAPFSHSPSLLFAVAETDLCN